MHRFFASPECFVDGKVFLPSEEVHHLSKVLRLRPGTKVLVFDGLGNEYEVKLVAVKGTEAWGQVVAQVSPIKEPVLEVVLAQGWAKREKNEFVAQKATEIGIRALIPMACQRSIIKTLPTSVKQDRLRRAVREAAKQCGRAVIPEVKPACAFTDLLPRFVSYDAVLLCWEREQAADLKRVLMKLRLKPLKRLLVLVGPEGGFTDREARCAIEHGAFSVGLGPRILRTETAGLVALSAIFYEFDELLP
jgi:16S rRNA (uracil1498-N3)-methyltransferase